MPETREVRTGPPHPRGEAPSLPGARKAAEGDAASSRAAGAASVESEPAATIGRTTSEQAISPTPAARSAPRRHAAHRRRSGPVTVRRSTSLAHALRTAVAALVWTLGLAAALLLALGALLATLHANPSGTLTGAVLRVDGRIGGPFSHLIEFMRNGHQDVALERLVNWGIAAVLYLLAARLLDEFIHPGRRT